MFEDRLHEFHCDDCAGGMPTNDPLLSTPCAANDDHLQGFLVSPAGAEVHHCQANASTWYDTSGNVIYVEKSGDPLIHLGHGDLALTPTSVVHLSMGTSTPIVGLPLVPFLTVRAKAPASFLVVVDQPALELWEIGADGVATKLGDYPPLPAGADYTYGYTSKLDACGAVLQFGSGPIVFEDIIVRREIGGASAVVYDEATKPAVKIHISSLFTGP